MTGRTFAVLMAACGMCLLALAPWLSRPTSPASVDPELARLRGDIDALARRVEDLEHIQRDSLATIAALLAEARVASIPDAGPAARSAAAPRSAVAAARPTSVAVPSVAAAGQDDGF